MEGRIYSRIVDAMNFDPLDNETNRYGDDQITNLAKTERKNKYVERKSVQIAKEKDDGSIDFKNEGNNFYIRSLTFKKLSKNTNT